MERAALSQTGAVTLGPSPFCPKSTPWSPVSPEPLGGLLGTLSIAQIRTGSGCSSLKPDGECRRVLGHSALWGLFKREAPWLPGE